MTEPPDDHSPLADAAEWTARITTICLELLLPIAGGCWLDHWLGTHVLFLIIGVILGFAVSLLSLLQISKSGGRNRHSGGSD
jgi:F0F1-type ATP synthase assembly protein I